MQTLTDYLVQTQFRSNIVGFIFIGFFNIGLSAQEEPPSPMTIENVDNIENLVLEKFVKENTCIKISNINPIGEEKSIGSFNGGASTIGIDEGIVFSTGNLEDIPGPNNSTGTTGSLTGVSDAPYLSRAVRHRTYLMQWVLNLILIQPGYREL